MKLGFALLALITPAVAFTNFPHSSSSVVQQRSSSTTAARLFPTIGEKSKVHQWQLNMASPQAAIDDALKAAGSGVALFGKSGCPFCKKTKKELYSIGVHPTIVELDQVEDGAPIQKKLEELTGQSTVPNVWLDGKFIGGSEEVISGVKSGMFDAVEKKEIIEMTVDEKIAVVQGPDAIKAGDAVPDAKVWVGFNSDDFITLADYGKDKNILVVGLPGAFTPT